MIQQYTFKPLSLEAKIYIDRFIKTVGITETFACKRLRDHSKKAIADRSKGSWLIAGANEAWHLALFLKSQRQRARFLHHLYDHREAING